MMIRVFIFGVLVVSSVFSEEKVETSQNGDFEGSVYLNTPQSLYVKDDDSLNYGHGDYNFLNQNSINSLEHQNIDGVEKYDSYAQHSNSHSYDYLAPKNNDLPYSHLNHHIRRGFVTNKIPSMKIDQPYYRTPPKYSNHDYNYVPYGHGRPKHAYEELALKNICVDCSNYNNEYSQNPAHHENHQHEKSDEVFRKDIYNPYLAQNRDYYYNHGDSHEAYDPVEAEKQRLLDKINYIYSSDMQYNKTTQDSSNPREPLYKSDPHYLHYKPHDSENNYEYRIKSNGLFPYGPKHVDYYPVRVNDYYQSYNYNNIKEPKLESYGPINYASHRNIPNDYSEELVYLNEHENFNTTNNDTKADRKVYNNPYFDYANRNVSGNDDNSNSTDLTAEVLKNLQDSKNKYPNSYFNPHENDIHNYKPKHFNNYAHDDYANNRHFSNEDIIQYPENRLPYNEHSNNLYHNEQKNHNHAHYNYAPNRHFKDVVEDVKKILHSRNKYGPYETYKDNQDHSHNNYKHLMDELKLYSKNHEPQVHANEHYTYPKNIDYNFGQEDIQRHYNHFKEVVEEVKELMQPKNKYDPYENVHATDFYHSRPRQRHYGKLTHPFDKTSVGVLHPYKVRPNPYILPEYRRYQSGYHDHPRGNYNHENLVY